MLRATRPWFGLVLVCAVGCSSISGSLGFRARRAAIEDDITRFDDLMREAAVDGPQFPGDKPVKTVLSHYLDLAAHSDFIRRYESWKQKNWVDDSMDCAVFRARYRRLEDPNSAEAEAMADRAIGLARIGARSKDRQWEVEACLGEAPFLTSSSTPTLARYIAIAEDVDEPPALRRAILDGMTHTFLREPELVRANEPELSKEDAEARSRSQYGAARARFVALIHRLEESMEMELIAPSTAFGALEIERVSHALGESFLAEWTKSASLFEHDIAWAWVRAMKSADQDPRLSVLGLWDRTKEPKEDAFWFACVTAGKQPDVVDAITVRSLRPNEDPDALLAAECKSPEDGAANPWILGPYPLEKIARHEARLEAQQKLGLPQRPKLRVRARKLLPAR